MKKEKIELNCKSCNSKFNVSPSRLKNAKVNCCSKKCASKYKSDQVNNKYACVICGTKVALKPTRIKRIKTGVTCSKECKNEHYKKIYLGNNNPNSLQRKEGFNSLELFFNRKICNLRHNAEQREIEFDLNRFDLQAQYEKQNGLCYYTGIPMSLVTTKNFKQKRQADLDILSVDRIDSNKGYIKNNIVLCCNAINKLKGSSDVLDAVGFINYISLKQSNVCHISVKKLNDNSNIPNKAKIGDAGYDLFASTIEDLGDRIKVGTGICVQPEAGWFCEVYSRSSNTKKGIMLMNSVGIIDNGYTGEIICIFYKTRSDAIINIGDRVAQLIPKRYSMVEFTEVNELNNTDRGTGGFGSTGK